MARPWLVSTSGGRGLATDAAAQSDNGFEVQVRSPNPIGFLPLTVRKANSLRFPAYTDPSILLTVPHITL
jgi:hypothetical protein